MSSPPPRFVPTLTEVVQPSPAVPNLSLDPSSAGLDRAAIEGQLVERVLRRVDLILERQLREAVGQLILEHTETLAPQLRQEIERVVRQSVTQAFAQEADGAVPVVKTGQHVESYCWRLVTRSVLHARFAASAKLLSG